MTRSAPSRAPRTSLGYRIRCASLGTLGALVALQSAALAQSSAPEWIPTFPSVPLPDLDGPVYAMLQFDDGSGEALYVAGGFRECAGQPASLVARYDGTSWDTLNGGIPLAPFSAEFFVSDLAVFDAGSGPELYACGYNGFTTNLARWDGFSWSLIPWTASASQTVFHAALEVYDLGDGFGERLFIGGQDITLNTPVLGSLVAGQLVPEPGIVWAPDPLGEGNYVSDLVGFDDGSGPALYLAGQFYAAETQGTGVARQVARYQNGQVSALDPAYWPPALNFGDVRLAVHPFGGTPRLVAAWSYPYGTISGLPAYLTAWDGVTWQDLGQLDDTLIGDIESFDAEDGLGPCIVVSGNFSSIDGQPMSGLARLHGTHWLPMLPQGNWIPASRLAAYRPEPSAPPSLALGLPALVGGYQPTAFLTRWQAGEVLPIHAPPAALNGGAKALCSFDSGNGLELYAGGDFTQAGGMQVAGLARWNGSSWSAVGSGLSGSVRALAVHDQGQGPWLYIGGSFSSPASNNLVAWDGTQFIACGPSLNGAVEALLSVPKSAFSPAAAIDQLYVAGSFTNTAAGGNFPRRVARWDGTWSGFQAGGMQSGPNDTVFALEFFKGNVYFGGRFTEIGNQPRVGLGHFAPQISLNFPGANVFDAGITGEVRALEGFGAGTAARLYVAGTLSAAGGQPATGIAAYTGQVWESVPPLNGFGGPLVNALRVHDDGSGDALYATGQFNVGAGVPVANLARFDGQVWAPLDNGLSGVGLAMATHPHPSTVGPALFVGCTLPGQPDSGDSYLAAWGREAVQGAPFTALPGCAAKQVVLTPSSGPLSPGQAETLQLSSPAAAGLALLYVGAPIGLPGGCGLQLAGVGELLLAPAPALTALPSAATLAGVSSFAFGVPANPALIGKTLLFQAAQLDLSQPVVTVELSSALAAKFQP